MKLRQNIAASLTYTRTLLRMVSLIRDYTVTNSEYRSPMDVARIPTVHLGVHGVDFVRQEERFHSDRGAKCNYSAVQRTKSNELAKNSFIKRGNS